MVIPGGSASIIPERCTRRQARRSENPQGAVVALRLAMTDLVSAGDAVVSSRELLDRAKQDVPEHTGVTLKSALRDELADPEGLVRRLRPGLVAMSAPGDAPGRGEARAHVPAVLEALADDGAGGVTRADIEVVLAKRGLRYSSRTVRHALARVVRDSDSAVTSPGVGVYLWSARRLLSAQAKTIRERRASAREDECRRIHRCSVSRSPRVNSISTVGRPGRAIIRLLL